MSEFEVKFVEKRERKIVVESPTALKALVTAFACDGDDYKYGPVCTEAIFVVPVEDSIDNGDACENDEGNDTFDDEDDDFCDDDTCDEDDDDICFNCASGMLNLADDIMKRMKKEYGCEKNTDRAGHEKNSAGSNSRD